MASSAFRVQGRPEDRVAAGGTASGGGGGGGAISLTFRGETEQVDVAVDPVAGTVTTALAPEFVSRVTTLEDMRALIEIKDSLASGGPANYMNFPGGTGNYISTPNHADYNVADDLCVVVRLQMPASAPSADMTIAARYNSLPGSAQWRFLLVATGALRFVSTVDGTAQSIPTSTALLPFDGNYIWLKVRRLSLTGDVGFWTAADTGSDSVLPTGWTPFTVNRTSTAGVLYNNSGALSLPLSIGAYNVGALFPFTGRIGRVLVYAGADTTGTLIADANAADYASGSTWTGSAGRVWTINGTASVVLVGGAISNTLGEFSLGESDPFPTLPLAVHDTLLWSTDATIVNTSGSNVNFTPKLKINGVDLFTFDPIVIPSSASKVYPLSCAVKVSINAVDGTTQIASAQLIVGAAVTGTDAGSSIMPTPLATVGPGVRSGAITTITTVPQIQLRMTMGTAASTISARPIRTELFVSKA